MDELKNEIIWARKGEKEGCSEGDSKVFKEEGSRMMGRATKDSVKRRAKKELR